MQVGGREPIDSPATESPQMWGGRNRESRRPTGKPVALVRCSKGAHATPDGSGSVKEAGACRWRARSPGEGGNEDGRGEDSSRLASAARAASPTGERIGGGARGRGCDCESVAGGDDGPMYCRVWG